MSRHHSAVHKLLSGDSVLVFLLFLFQTLTITSLTLILEQVVFDQSVLVIALIGSFFLMLTAGVAVWREQIRKRGTIVAIIVRRSMENWALVKAAAGEFQARERFKYWYPLVDARRPPLPREGDTARTANWSSHLETSRGMLSMIFDQAHGAPVDLSRVALMINAPLPLSFKLGTCWPDAVPDATEFELVQLSFPDSGVSPSPTVVWRSKPADRRVRGSLGPPTVLAIRTISRFHTEWLEGQYGQVQVIGGPMEIGANSQHDIDALLSEARQEITRHERVTLALATTAPIAFALGYWMADLHDRIEVVEYAPPLGYVPVSFEAAADSGS